MTKAVHALMPALAGLMIGIASLAEAQTPIQPQTPGGVQGAGAIREQHNGVYPPLGRQGNQAAPVVVRAEGGQIQDAWSYEDNLHTGYYETFSCGSCVHKVRLRDQMITAIILPEGEQIEIPDFGHPAFDGKRRAPNVFTVKANGFGVDTSLLLHTKKGNVYAFYLRAESINSETVPDIVYKIRDRQLPDHSFDITKPLDDASDLPERVADAIAKAPDLSVPALARVDKALPKDAPMPDFAKVKVDPEQIHGFRQYRVFGSEDSDGIMPSVIYRDDKFTYLQFPEDTWKRGAVPVAFVTEEGIDQVVNTRLSGTTLIVEKLTRLITLKYGKSYICIEYEGDV